MIRNTFSYQTDKPTLGELDEFLTEALKRQATSDSKVTVTTSMESIILGALCPTTYTFSVELPT